MAGIIVAVAAGILGLVSAALGFAAEATKIRPHHVYDSTSDQIGCTHPKSPALALGLVAALLLLIAQILLNAFTGCGGCCKRTPAIKFIIISWITFVSSFIMFTVGAIVNRPRVWVSSFCTPVAPGNFAMASIFSLLTVVLGINAYFLFHNTKDAGITSSKPGIAMATPQY